ncbi:hypothetical protein [Bradyrhizobium sp. LVM 105]|uniref:hypothetical protein n=1 Tax=Bradyrhizobium sp. LVM 105 TaxID=2341115 RepID=UPI000F8076FE|nr:hypothetical protein [Bradyrhizobium sp. LVM 105]RTE92763.1 hypothetical protein D6B98_14875 [Bradyrhizobium sp. LVM 105]
MSNIDAVEIERDQRTGRFLTGNSGGGRKPGARAKFSERFVADLAKLWDEQGEDILLRLARDDPAALLKVLASLMPKTIDLNANVGIDARNVLDAFRSAVGLLGNEPPKVLPKVKVIDVA